jgi:hypothetical protein
LVGSGRDAESWFVVFFSFLFFFCCGAEGEGSVRRVRSGGSPGL